MSRARIFGLFFIIIVAVLAAVLALRYDVVSLMTVSPPVAVIAEPAQKPPSALARQAGVKPGERQATEKQAAETPSTKFDVVRIDPDGASVFAGRAPPNSAVTVMANERPVASATASASGEWAIVTDRPFAAGDTQLSLTAKLKDAGGRQVQGQSVRINIASNPRGTESTASVVPVRRTPALLPITFAYDQTIFTPEGSKAAAALIDHLNRQKLPTVTLTGHADERGSDQYNMDLSQQRLDAVARYLRESGYAGKLVLQPMGKREPYGGIDRRSLTQDQAFQLDRRVQLRLTQ